MRKVNLLALLLMAGLSTSCLKEENLDKVKTVTMVFYSEIGYGSSIMSHVFTEQIVFSDSEDKEKRLLSDIITENFDFNYEIGYEYRFKAKKIKMHEPPQDASSIKYAFIGPLNRKKMLTEDSVTELTLEVKPVLVQFYPRFSEPDEMNIYDALHCINKSDNKSIIIKEIEGFNFESGYEYLLRVKKFTFANPFSEKYKLIEVVSAHPKAGVQPTGLPSR
ncbi:MAG: DUF4377 domain-containing protein [Bacteroidales bacterium]|jgi:hypothetical protein|nr:DUF4377 domain-containing protein [Bacteroidales bacterium]MDY0174187.1 DUF4377 domain-containing protein [Bacteroidales bacterium]HHV40193.1 DUF4377 domain-containing protein [Bacteroidales bacterium]